MNLQILTWAELDAAQRKLALQRPIFETTELKNRVAEIIAAVRSAGDEALIALTRELDHCELQDLALSPDALDAARSACPKPLMDAMQDASEQIREFHKADFPTSKEVETVPGMRCESRYQPLDTVGLYVPGGTAPLVSTALMLGVPAQIAGCRKIVLCTPPGPDGTVAPELLAAISLCGIDQVFCLGGAQAIAAMAYGTETVPRCDKLFGPGNAWVTEAKQQVCADPDGAAMDLPAGPSEVMVIADATADPRAIAWDLLSQAEHGGDSQVILLTDAPDLARSVSGLTYGLVKELPRAEVLQSSLKAARIILLESVDQAIEIAALYAPEHLIINTSNARQTADKARNAGSVFIGPWTPESLGDYCSGTNHVLPTYGWARSHGALSVVDFMRRYTVQEASLEALRRLGPTAEALAAVEGLDAHRMAVTYRLRGAGSP